MVVLIAKSLIGKWRRSLGLTLALVIVVSGFLVLVGTAEVSRLELLGTVDEQGRPVYDILVRPAGSATGLERDQSLVRSNFLADNYGGISLDDVETIRGVPGVEVAAPISMIGFTQEGLGGLSVPVRDVVDLDGDTPVLFRMRETRTTDSGSTQLPERTTWSLLASMDRFEDASAGWVFGEVFGEPACDLAPLGLPDGPLEPRLLLQCGRIDDEAEFRVDWPIPLLLAAVDPEAEARLVGLDKAVVEGEYLDRSAVVPRAGAAEPGRIPVLLSARHPLWAESTFVVEQAAPQVAAEAMHHEFEDLVEMADDAGFDQVGSFSVGAAQAYDQVRDQLAAGLPVVRLWQPGPVDVHGTDRLVPRYAPEPTESHYDTEDMAAFEASVAPETADAPFREVEVVLNNAIGKHLDPAGVFNNSVGLELSGIFEAEELALGQDLTGLALSEYFAPELEAADASANAALADGVLLPNGSMAGYLQQAPSLLTTIEALDLLLEEFAFDDGFAAAPVSAVRVRVAGVTGLGELDRERVRAVAESIEDATGLDVDVVMGSSVAPKELLLPAGRFGRPDLHLVEQWSVKGVAAVIQSAIERKTLALFTLVLTVCGLFVANASAASVRSRRGELGALAFMGWTRRGLFALVLGELAVIGAVAGGFGVGVAWLAGTWVRSMSVPVPLALAALPLALAVALMAGLVPAWLASRAEPLAALHPATVGGRQTRLRWGLWGLGISGLWRTPGRALVGVAAVGIAAAAVAALAAVALAFDNQVTGTLLGDAITVQARPSDVIAVVVMVILAMVAVGDVLYLNVRDRASEFAALRANGWRDAHWARVVMVEGASLGFTGGALGAVAGAALVVAFMGGADGSQVLPIAAGVALTGVLAGMVASVWPVAAMRRLPTLRLLTEE